MDHDLTRPASAQRPDAEAQALLLRVRALEVVVALERKLRRAKEEDLKSLHQRISSRLNHSGSAVSSTAPMIDPDATRLASPDPDATRLAPAPDPDATRLALTPDPDATRIAPARVALVNTPPAAGSPRRFAAPEDKANALVLPLQFSLHEYRIDAVLGQGGFGITYLATDINLNTKVAVKEYLPADFACRSSDRSVTPRSAEHIEVYQTGLDSFLLEARTLATFRHPNIVRVVRFFEAHRTAYIVLEYERGQSLKAWWPDHVDLPEQELLALLRPLLDGLALVHQFGYLHRDIKPDNIYSRRDDGSLVLLDFGSARQTAGGGENMAVIVTPGYAPGEQYRGEDQGPWTDVYAVGATLYWMVCGKKPPPAPLRLPNSDPMRPASEIAQGRFSAEFLQAIDWALKIAPAERPQSVAEFCRALFAAHSASLGLQEALRADDKDSQFAVGARESWRALLNSPRLLQRRLQQLGRVLLRPWSWPMVVKMTLTMVLAALLPMVITAYYNLNGSVASVSRSESRNLERLAQSTAGRVAQLLDDCRHLANYLATDKEFIGFLRDPNEAGAVGLAAIDAKIKNLLATNPDVHRLILFDKNGLALVSNDPAVTGRNSSFREYFQEARAGRPFMTGILLSTTDGSPGIYYSNPVFDASHQVIGAIVLRIKGGTVSTLLEENIEGTGQLPFLIDGDGVLIHHPDARLLYSSLAPLSLATHREIVADKRFGRDRIVSLGMDDLAKAMMGSKTHGNISYRSSVSQEIEHAGYAPVPGHDWVVGITEPRSQFEAPLNRLFNNVLYSVILVGLIFLLLSILFARSIVRPIIRLTDAANALKQGDYDHANIRVNSDDEIGRLARTFNVMIDVLRQRERERKRGRAGDD